MRGALLTHRVKPEHLQEFIDALRRFAQASTNMPGCLRYDVMQDTRDPTIVFAHGVYRDDEAWALHFYSDAAKTWRAVSQDWRLPSAPDAEPPNHRHRLSYIHPSPDDWK